MSSDSISSMSFGLLVLLRNEYGRSVWETCSETVIMLAQNVCTKTIIEIIENYFLIKLK